MTETMNSANGSGNPGTMMASAHGAAARCLARALVVAFDACDEADIPLSELQRAALVEAALLEFDGFALQLSSLATVSRLIEEMGHFGPPRAR